jgi:hypothetical protein
MLLSGAGMTWRTGRQEGVEKTDWIPACAGMTQGIPAKNTFLERDEDNEYSYVWTKWQR